MRALAEFIMRGRVQATSGSGWMCGIAVVVLVGCCRRLPCASAARFEDALSVLALGSAAGLGLVAAIGRTHSA